MCPRFPLFHVHRKTTVFPPSHRTLSLLTSTSSHAPRKSRARTSARPSPLSFQRAIARGRGLPIQSVPPLSISSSSSSFPTIRLHHFLYLVTFHALFAPLLLPLHFPPSICTSSSPSSPPTLHVHLFLFLFTTCTLSTPLRLSPHCKCAWPWPRVKRWVKSRHGGTAPRGTRRARRVVRHRHAPSRTSQARLERSEEA